MVATRSEPQTIETDVLVSGGGPCGLMLAIELGRCGVRCLVVDAKPGTAFNPRQNADSRRARWSTSGAWPSPRVAEQLPLWLPILGRAMAVLAGIWLRTWVVHALCAPTGMNW